MSRNGAGLYSLPPGSTVANGDTSDASDINTPIADLAADNNVARPIVAGGTGATSASAARTNLGLVIGTDVQAFDATLTSLAALGTVADRFAYTTGVDTWAEATVTAAGRAILDDADAAAQRTTLGLGTAAVVDVIDEDDFTTDSATRPPSQQSTKAFVLANKVSLDIATAQDTTSGTAFTFTGIPDTANEIIVIFDNVGVSGSDSLLVQLGTSGGVVTSGYTNSVTLFMSTGGSSLSSAAGFPILLASDSRSFSGTMRLTRISGDKWVSDHTGTSSISGGAGTVSLGGGVSPDLGAAADRVNITRTGTNTFDTGSVTVAWRS